MRLVRTHKIVIVDYNLGNLFSVANMCDHLGFDAKISSNKNEILDSDFLILPGVGAFGDAMATLKSLDLIEPIRDFVNSGKPIMGVCLGMQLLFTESEEFGNNKGLGIVNGVVKRFPAYTKNGERVKIPQIEWNSIHVRDNSQFQNSPLKDCSENDFMYFVHSYYVVPEDESVVLTTTDYGGVSYCSSILSKNVFACQFHPEKSAHNGISIYSNFLNQ